MLKILFPCTVNFRRTGITDVSILESIDTFIHFKSYETN